jgi:hypothetical protein
VEVGVKNIIDEIRKMSLGQEKSTKRPDIVWDDTRTSDNALPRKR